MLYKFYVIYRLFLKNLPKNNSLKKTVKDDHEKYKIGERGRHRQWYEFILKHYDS